MRALRCTVTEKRLSRPEDFRYVSIHHVNTLPRAQTDTANGARGMRGCDTGCETGKRLPSPLARLRFRLPRTFVPPPPLSSRPRRRRRRPV